MPKLSCFLQNCHGKVSEELKQSYVFKQSTLVINRPKLVLDLKSRQIQVDRVSRIARWPSKIGSNRSTTGGVFRKFPSVPESIFTADSARTWRATSVTPTWWRSMINLCLQRSLSSQINYEIVETNLISFVVTVFFFCLDFLTFTAIPRHIYLLMVQLHGLKVENCQ